MKNALQLIINRQFLNCVWMPMFIHNAIKNMFGSPNEVNINCDNKHSDYVQKLVLHKNDHYILTITFALEDMNGMSTRRVKSISIDHNPEDLK